MLLRIGAVITLSEAERHHRFAHSILRMALDDNPSQILGDGTP